MANQEAFSIISRDPNIPETPQQHMEWAAGMVRQGLEGKAREDMAGAGVSEEAIEASFLQPQIEFRDELTKTAEERDQAIADIQSARETRAQLDRERAALNKERDDYYNKSRPSIGEDGRPEFTSSNISADQFQSDYQARMDDIDSRLYEAQRKAYSKFGEVSAAIQTLEPSIASSDETKAMHDKAVQAGIEILQLTYGDGIEFGYDSDGGFLTVDGEEADSEMIDWLVANTNTAAATGGLTLLGLTALIGRGGSAVATLAGGASLLSLPGLAVAGATAYALSEVEKRDRRQAAEKLGLILNRRYEANRQARDVAIGVVSHGVIAAGGVLGVGAAKGVGLVKDAGGVNYFNLGKDFVRNLTNGGAPVRRDVVDTMRNKVGLKDQAEFDKQYDIWFNRLADGDKTEVPINDIAGLSPFAKSAVMNGVSKVITPGKANINSDLTQEEREFLFLISTKKDAIKIFSQQLKDNPNININFLKQGVDDRARSFNNQLKNKLSREDLNNLVSNIHADTRQARLLLEQNTMNAEGFPVRLGLDDISRDMPQAVKSKISSGDMTVYDFVEAIDKAKPDQKGAMKRTALKYVDEKVFNQYERAIKLSRSGLVKEIGTAKTEDDIMKVLIKYNRSTDLNPDWNALLVASVKDSPDTLNRLQNSIVDYVGAKHTNVRSDGVMTINEEAIWKELAPLKFSKGSEAEAQRWLAQENYILYKNSDEYVSELEQGFSATARGDAGGLSDNPMQRAKTYFGGNVLWTRVKSAWPNSKAFRSRGFLNSGLRFAGDDPVKYKDYGTRLEEVIGQGATK